MTRCVLIVVVNCRNVESVRCLTRCSWFGEGVDSAVYEKLVKYHRQRRFGEALRCTLIGRFSSFSSHLNLLLLYQSENEVFLALNLPCPSTLHMVGDDTHPCLDHAQTGGMLLTQASPTTLLRMRNLFAGTNPKELGNLTALQHLCLSGNWLLPVSLTGYELLPQYRQNERM